MKPIHYKLSTKCDERNYQELILIVRNKKITSSGKSGIRIDATYFDKVKGIDEDALNRKRLQTKEVKDAKAALIELNTLRKCIQAELIGKELKKELLQGIINNFYNKGQEELTNSKPSLEELFERYLEAKQFNQGIVRGRKVLLRTILRFEGFTRYKSDPNFVFDVDTITREDIEAFKTYLEKEDKYSVKYPRLYSKLLSKHYVSMNKGRNKITGRGENTRVRMLKELKAFFTWLNENDLTENRPFEGVKFRMQIFGTPSYITIEERNKIAEAVMPSKHLETQRDIFIFHCLIGCRVSDLVTLTSSNVITEGDVKILQYVPIKTKNDKTDENSVRVPLLSEALKYIEKYKGADKKKRLMPFISSQKYNEAIKEVFTIADVTREVPLRNSRTGETEYKPINEVASSHMARRTFVGNLYFKVQDPNLIGEMSGHTYGSRAFKRYRKVETSTLSDTIKLLEG